jgi:hypothetical protein
VTPHRRPLSLLLAAGVTLAGPALLGVVPATAASPAAPAPGGPAAAERRVDLDPPVFSHPTRITNPLFPVNSQRRVVQLGTGGSAGERAEITRLPYTRTIRVFGQTVPAVVSQYVAHLDGRVAEVAYDFFAQADDGSVWYLGEDVFNYEDGLVADTEGSWLAGRDGPGGMIMPARPKVGDVFRPENIPGLVFETVTVKATGLTLNGPRGPVRGGIRTQERLMDGSVETKVYAPGYGEFIAGSADGLEAVAVAAPADALAGPLPGQLTTLAIGATRVFDSVRSRDWRTAAAAVDRMVRAYDAYQRRNVPPLLDAAMTAAVTRLVATVDARQPAAARQAALDVTRATLDLQLQFRPALQVDLALVDAWARQVSVDRAAGDRAGVLSDLAILDAIGDRVRPYLDRSAADRLAGRLSVLRAAAGTAVA